MEYCESIDEMDETMDDVKSSSRTSDENRKQNHSEIEKRRRDKMNLYINELSSMIPLAHAMHRKLDKLTVLRMAVQHLRRVRGTVHPYSGGDFKPSFLSDQELKMLILQNANSLDGFLFVVGCDRGRILYLSESVSNVLNCTQADLLGQSWFDVLHPKDVAKVKDQLSSMDPPGSQRFIDPKTMLPLKTNISQGMSRLCPGARRSFFCRMKIKGVGSSNSSNKNNLSEQFKEESDTSSISSSRSSSRRKSKLSIDYKYRVIQCTGYLKSWAMEDNYDDDQNSASNANLSCLVAIGKIPQLETIPKSLDNHPNIRQIVFISRHSVDGKFLFIDQRATLVIGFLPQEILGTSFYEYFHHEDIPALAESHKNVLAMLLEKVTTKGYRFRCKDNRFIQLQSEWRAFKNPWTSDIEYIMAKNSVFL